MEEHNCKNCDCNKNKDEINIEMNDKEKNSIDNMLNKLNNAVKEIIENEYVQSEVKTAKEITKDICDTIKKEVKFIFNKRDNND
jgi:hypothetical protein